MSRGWHLVRVLLIVSLISGASAASVRAAPRPAPAGVADPTSPVVQQGVREGGTFSRYGGLSPFASVPTDTAQQGSLGQALEQIDRLEPIIGDLQKALDRSQFDLDALCASLEYDAARIVDYVRNEIAFEQYPGVLRGELGTVIGRAGNAFDQALLLRRLLDDAGYETRLVRTTLTEAQARALVAQMALPRDPAPPIADPEILTDIRSRLRDVSGTSTPLEMSAQEKVAAAHELVADDASLLLDELEGASVELGQAGVVDALEQEARDYLWVQYRLNPYGPWIDGHVAFADTAAAPARLSVAEFYRDTLPDDLYHRVRLAVTVEQKLGDQLITTPIVSNWERRAADLYGQPVIFQNRPDNLDLEMVKDAATLIRTARLFVPFVNGKMADRAFDLAGGTYSVSLLSLGALAAAQVGQSTIGAVDRITGMLEGEEVQLPADSMELTAQWIDYTLVAPDGDQTSFRRYVMDRVGEANRSQGRATITDQTPLLEAAKALLTSHTIMVLPGEYSPAYISHRAVTRTLTELSIRSYIQADGTVPEFPYDELNTLTPLEDVILNATFANAIAPGDGIVAYRPEPTLVVYEQGLRPTLTPETAYELVDVLHNTRRVFSVTGGVVAPAPEEAVRIGVWETLAERSILRQTAEPFGALEAIRLASGTGIRLQVLRPGDATVLQALQHSASTKASVQRDLEAGYLVIIPERSGETSTDVGWWRVDPATGETLGITSVGYGGAMAEYVITVVFASIFGFTGYNVCRNHGGSAGCCLGETALWAVLGIILGVGIGEAAGYITTAGWGYAILMGDAGLGLASLFIPSICH